MIRMFGAVGKGVMVALLLACLAPATLSAASLPAGEGADSAATPVAPAGFSVLASGGEVITWSGAAGDGAWSNPGNWVGGRVPGPGDTARLSGPAPNARVDAAFGGVVGGLLVGADYAGTLRLECTLWVQGDLEMAGGTLEGGEAGLTVGGAARVSGGVLVTPAGAAMNAVTLEIDAPGVVRLGTNGKLNLSGSGQPLWGDGLLDTTTYRPNSVEYTGAATADLTAAGPVQGLLAATPEGFSYVGTLTLQPGEEFLASTVIDPAGAYAYFGDWTTTGHVFKVDLSTFTQVGTLTLPAGEERPVCAVIDPVGAYAYFGTYATSPGRVVKVDLTTFTRAGALTLAFDEDSLSAVIDPAGAYAYFGTYYPGRVVKVDLATFTRAGAVALNAGEEVLVSAVIDPAGEYAYFGTQTSPGIVVKVDLGTFTRAGALTLNAGENSLESAVIDPAGAHAYFGTSTSPGIVVRVDLATFTRVGALTLNAGEDYLNSGVIDLVGGYAYFGASPMWTGGIVVQVDLASFTRATAVTLGEKSLQTAAIDPAGEYAYFGTFESPGRVVKIELGGSSTWTVYLPVALKNSP